MLSPVPLQALDAAKGMLYLHAHSPPIIHRDLKSANLLVDKHWRVKVCDFNLSKLMEENSVMSSMAATNPRWLAPEILAGSSASFSSDVYAFGCAPPLLARSACMENVVGEGASTKCPPSEILTPPRPHCLLCSVVLWEILTWELPWGTTNPWQVVTVVSEGGRLELPPRSRIPGPDTQSWDGLPAFYGIIESCWAQNPADRPTFGQVIARLR